MVGGGEGRGPRGEPRSGDPHFGGCAEAWPSSEPVVWLAASVPDRADRSGAGVWRRRVHPGGAERRGPGVVGTGDVWAYRHSGRRADDGSGFESGGCRGASWGAGCCPAVGMISVPPGTRVVVASEPVDGRKGMDTLGGSHPVAPPCRSLCRHDLRFPHHEGRPPKISGVGRLRLTPVSKAFGAGQAYLAVGVPSPCKTSRQGLLSPIILAFLLEPRETRLLRGLREHQVSDRRRGHQPHRRTLPDRRHHPRPTPGRTAPVSSKPCCPGTGSPASRLLQPQPPDPAPDHPTCAR